MHAFDTHVVLQPRGLDIATLSQRLYPEVYDPTADQRSLLVALTKYRREYNALRETPSPGVPAENVARQIEAIRAARNHAYDRVCELYFAKPGWTQVYLDGATSDSLTWYFMASFNQGRYDSTAYRRSYYDGIQLYGYGRHRAVSVERTTDEVVLHSFIQLTLKPNEFRGPAHGLVDWTRDNEIFLKVVAPSVTH